MMALLLRFSKKYCTKHIKSANSFEKADTVKCGDKTSIFRTITQEDVLNFAKLTGDNNPIHVDLKKNIVHGAFLNGLVSAAIGTKLPGPGSIVVEQKFRFPNSCYVGDAVEVIINISSVKRIITCEYTCIANSNNIVMEGEAKIIKKIKL